MKTKHLLNEELHPILDAIPSIDINDALLPIFREQSSDIKLGKPEDYGVSREEIFIDGEGGKLRCLLYTPIKTTADNAAYVHIHGGGYIFGSPEGSDAANLNICKKLNIVILSVDYRLAPEHPIPAPLDDCYSALAWVHDNAAALGVDASRIAIGGESAGGGLAAAVTIKARDHGKYAICHQHLTYPMLDNLSGDEQHMGDPLVGEFVWTRQRNQYGWGCFLGGAPAVAPQVPARVESYANLPPAWIFTVSMDLFRDEDIDYARKLMAAGIKVDLQVYAGACHAFQMVPNTKIGARFAHDHLAALARGLGIDI